MRKFFQKRGGREIKRKTRVRQLKSLKRKGLKPDAARASL